MIKRPIDHFLSETLKRIILTYSFLLIFAHFSAAQDFYFNALTSENGLSHNSVFSITQDHKGFIWFGTRNGVNRYDSQRIKNYPLNAFNPNAEASRVNCLYTVGSELWVGTPVGLFRYLFDKDEFVPIPLGKPLINVSVIQRVSTGELWIGSRDGVYILEKNGAVRHILPNQNIHAISEFRKGSFLILQNNSPHIINAGGEVVANPVLETIRLEKAHTFRDYKFFKNRQGAIWLSTESDLLQLDETALTFRPVEWFTRLIKGHARVIRTVVEDQAGNVWIGGESGVVMVDSKRQTAHWYDKSYTASPYGLTDRAVYSSFVSRDGMVWLGTYFGGVNYTKPVGISFEHLFPATDGQTIAGKAISSLAIDGQDRIWIGSEDGGISVQDRSTGRYTYHNRSNGLSDNNIHAILLDQSGVAWIGTFLGGLNRIDPVSGEKRVFMHNPDDPTSLSSNYVNTLCRDRTGRLWVGTTRGVNILDEKTGTFQLFKPGTIGNTFIIDIQDDTEGRIWMATSHSGIYQYDPRLDRLTHFHAGNTPVLRGNQISSVYEDSNQNVWFGSLNAGVYQWNFRHKKFIRHPIQNRLANQTVYQIVEDNNGTYWFSTNHGLISYNPKQKAYRVFDGSNGLEATQFNFKSSLKDQRGYLYFGSVDGLCYFNPDVITKRVVDPPVYFTDLKLFNKEVKADGELMLTKRLDETSDLVFNYAQNVITLDFVAINYFSKRANYYTYYLEGFEETWGPKTTLNSQTYTNLSPGDYTFHVRAFQSNGDLSPTERTLRITINPPFWRTGFAYLIYGLFGIMLLILYRRIITYLNRQKMAVQVERVEREKSRELTQQKLNFFTFLSNEFKTPITLIIAEIDELMQNKQAWQTESATNYGVIKKNARRLQALIDQITELRKTGHEIQKIHLADADIIAFIKETLKGFDPLLRARQIHKRQTFSPPYLMASFDAGKLEMIIGNVFFYLIDQLSEGDELGFDVEVVNGAESGPAVLWLTYTFEGQSEQLKSIETDYQYAGNSEEIFRQDNSLSIGMLLAFSLLKLLSGRAVFSDESARWKLSLQIPIQKTPVGRTNQITKLPNSINRHIVDPAEVSLLPDGELVGHAGDEAVLNDKPNLLIIERSKELAQFLKRHYGETYRISVANTFAEALKKAETMLPEIILCDNDIYDKEHTSVCLALKRNPLTQHVPVILLLDNEDDKTIIEGLNNGADGYIGKPFSLKELDLMLSNQLKTVSLLKTKLTGSLAGSLRSALPRRNKDQEFVLRFATLVNQQYKNRDVTADVLAKQMNCSRSQLHAKLKTLTGLSTKEYLNDYRLVLARQLLEGGMSVTEAAFEVGFNDPNYFGRAFKNKFGIMPSKVY